MRPAPPAAAAPPPPPLLERARRLLCWSARDKGHLGLGTMLYLNALRWMALTFFVIGLLTAPNASLNSFGPRYPFSAFSGDFIDYASTHVSIANLGAVDWTPGADSSACSGNGFAALVCEAGGWTPGKLDAWDFPCGSVPPGVTSASGFEAVLQTAKRRLYSNEAGVNCAAPVTVCRCFAGWGGASCSYPVPLQGGDPGSATGFCEPPAAWWLLSGGERTAAQAASAQRRSLRFCSGAGACVTRTSVDDISRPAFSFCQCDAGFFGRHCEQAETGAETYGDFYNVAMTGFNTTRGCGVGATPSIERDFFLVKFPRAACRLHGFGELLPANAWDGSLNRSSFFRVQTRGVCFCEPGFAGEECLGGAPVPPSEGFLACATSIVLVLAVALLYRHRKAVEQDLDDALVTPRDFTVFVDGLPSFDAGAPADLARVRAHFEQFGPVECVAPAPDDENVFYLTREKNDALSQLQTLVEMEKHDAGVRAARGRADAARSLGVATAATMAAARDVFGEADAAGDARAARSRAGWRPRPTWYPRTSPLLGEEVPASAARSPIVDSASCASSADPPDAASAWDSRAGLVRVLAWSAVLRSVIPAPALRALVRHLDALLAAERADPDARHFQRAFVTFRLHRDMGDCLEAYSERGLARMVKAPQQRWCCCGGRGAVVAAAAAAAEAAAPPPLPPTNALSQPSLAVAAPEIGTLEVVSSRTGETRTVNLLFAAAAEDKYVGLSEGLGRALARTTSSFSLNDNNLSRSRREALEAANSALSAHGLSASAVDDAAHSSASESAATGLQADAIVEDDDEEAPTDGAARLPAVAAAPPAPPPRRAIKVRQATEPDEVIWASLDTSRAELAVRALGSLVYMGVLIVALFYVVTSANADRNTGALGFAVAIGVVLLNVAVAAQWVLVADVEQNYSVGARMRSVFFKVLATQLAITVLSGTLGVYGYPLDAKNGYVQDWFSGAGGFLFRTLLIETLLPPLLVLAPIQQLVNFFFEVLTGMGRPSRKLWLEMHAPPPFNLEVSCASLMRCVILCCAFNAGLPVLNFATAACLAVRYLCDVHVLDAKMQLQRSGSELPRAIELTLLFASFVQALMSWVILASGWAGNAANEVVFLLLAAVSAWATLGYFSWKRARARDCCGGFALLALRWLAARALPARCGARAAELPAAALAAAHSAFMRLALGGRFFGEVEDAHDETGGRPYAELSALAQAEILRGCAAGGAPLAAERLASAFLLRRAPYEMPERVQSAREAAALAAGGAHAAAEPDASQPPLMPAWSGRQQRAWIARGAERGAAAAEEAAKAYARSRGRAS